MPESSTPPASDVPSTRAELKRFIQQLLQEPGFMPSRSLLGYVDTVKGAAEPNLRVVRGVITTTAAPAITIDEGSGFGAARNGPGDVTITITTAFADVPAVEAQAFTAVGNDPRAMSGEGTPTTTSIRLTRWVTATGAKEDGTFHFSAIGPA
jgi:hypothetical protein